MSADTEPRPSGGRFPDSSPNLLRKVPARRWFAYSPLWIALAAVTASLLGYSQTMAWYPDEPFHLVAAQLVESGRRPYLEFFHQHPPLYPYLLGAWMLLFGQSWRSAHTLSALLSVLTLVIVARSTQRQLEVPAWETWGAVAAVVWLGLHSLVVRQGTVGHPYALAMVCAAAAYHCALVRSSFAAGLFAGAAAASSLLWAPVGPVLLVWLVSDSRGSRVRAAGWFAAGFALCWIPVLWLALHGPWVVWFNLVEYHLVHRQMVRGPGLSHNLGVLSWLPRSSQGLFLIALSAAALVLAARRQFARRRELYLAAALAAVLWIFAACVRPTFTYYLMPVIPFLAVLAPVGLYAVVSEVRMAVTPPLLVALLTAIYLFGPIRFAIPWREYRFWQLRDAATREVNLLIPPQAVLYAPEWLYFTSKRLPPAGLNNFAARLVKVGPEQRARLHLVSKEQLEGALQEGRFDAVLSEGGEPPVEALYRLYRHSRRFDFLVFFWDPLSSPRSGP